MVPVFLDRFRDLIAAQGKAAVRTIAARLAAHGNDVLEYIPFEHVERSARLVLVGITPGPTQLEIAYEEAAKLINAGASNDEVLREAKRRAGFGGSSMRPNLVRMLNHFDFGGIFNVSDGDAFWADDSRLLHATSVVPHAAFRKDKMFAGSFAEVLGSPIFKECFLRDFVGSIPELDAGARFVALGQTPRDALDWCVANGHLTADRVLGAFAHPSTSGGSAVNVYLGLKGLGDLKPADPIRHRVAQLQADARRMEEATAPLRPEGSRRTLAARKDIEPPKYRPIAPTVPQKHVVARADGPADKGLSPEVLQALADAEYVKAGGTKKAELFVGRSEITAIYIRQGQTISVVVHPDALVRAREVLKHNGAIGDAYHNSNMAKFPKRSHGGKNLINYGYPVTFATADAMREFLRAFDRGGD